MTKMDYSRPYKRQFKVFVNRHFCLFLRLVFLFFMVFNSPSERQISRVVSRDF